MTETIQNPFVFVNTVVTGSDFTGRKEKLAELTSLAAKGGMTFIVGLPRMGKTSIVQQCFMAGEQPKVWQQEYKHIPIYLTFEDYATPQGFWDGLAKKIKKAARQWQKQHRDCTEEIDEVIDRCSNIRQCLSFDEMYNDITEAIDTFCEETGMHFIFILDELDCLLRNKYDRHQIQKICSLAARNSLVTCSRRTPQLIEKSTSGSEYFSGKSRTMFLTVFSDDDVTEYWERFEAAFARLSKEQFKTYKSLVKSYTGHHPMLMSLMNYYSINNGNLEAWCKATRQTEREKEERAIRVELKKAFDEQMHYVEEQGLKESATGLVTGGLKLPPEEDTMMLLNYGFVRKVPRTEKRELFGYDLGPVTADRQAYVCLSDFASHLMREYYRPAIKGIELVEITEKRLQELVRAGLKQQFRLGDDCFEVVSESEKTAEELMADNPRLKREEAVKRIAFQYKEKWELRYEREKGKLPEKLEDVKKVRYKRTLFECRPKEEIDLVSSAMLGELWNIFIGNTWRFYSKVLDAETWVGTYYPDKGRNQWYDKWFDNLLNYRNTCQHFHKDGLSEETVKKAEAACNSICDSINKWMEKQRRS